MRSLPDCFLANMLIEQIPKLTARHRTAIRVAGMGCTSLADSPVEEEHLSYAVVAPALALLMGGLFGCRHPMRPASFE